MSVWRRFAYIIIGRNSWFLAESSLRPDRVKHVQTNRDSLGRIKKRRASRIQRKRGAFCEPVISEQSSGNRCIPPLKDSAHGFLRQFLLANNIADPCSDARTVVQYSGCFCWLHNDSFSFCPLSSLQGYCLLDQGILYCKNRDVYLPFF